MDHPVVSRDEKQTQYVMDKKWRLFTSRIFLPVLNPSSCHNFIRKSGKNEISRRQQAAKCLKLCHSCKKFTILHSKLDFLKSCLFLTRFAREKPRDMI